MAPSRPFRNVAGLLVSLALVAATASAQPGQIQVVKRTNGTDNNSPPGPSLPLGSTATFTYVLTNPGAVTATNIFVRDDNGTPASLADDFNPTFVGGDGNGNGQLDTTETWTYSATRIVTAGQHTNVGQASAVVSGDIVVSSADPDNHFGVSPTSTPTITPTPGGVATLSEPGLLILGLLLAAAGFFFVRGGARS
jgi:hypothetical protein